MLSDVQIANLKGWRLWVYFGMVFLSWIVYYSPKIMFRGVYHKLLEKEQEVEFWKQIVAERNEELAKLRPHDPYRNVIHLKRRAPPPERS